jgi:hypothetical protein
MIENTSSNEADKSGRWDILSVAAIMPDHAHALSKPQQPTCDNNNPVYTFPKFVLVYFEVRVGPQ